MGRLSLLATVYTAKSNIVLTRSASGFVSIDQLTTSPSKQSFIGVKYTLPAGIWNSGMSVSHFSLFLSIESGVSRHVPYR